LSLPGLTRQSIRVARLFIAENGKLTGLLICANAFPGWDSFAALVSHLKFVRDHHRQVARVAAVTDSEFLRIMPHIAKHFVSAQVRQFSSDEKTEALAWLEAGHERSALT
jgi:SpoIIAA-like